MSYDFETWKMRKIARGEWIPKEKYLEKKRKELKPHSKLKNEFEVYYKEVVEEEQKLRRSPRLGKRKRETEDLNDEERQRKKSKIFLKREVILDTETTGLSDLDAIVEISILEMVDGVKTGRVFHRFLNPVVAISKKAQEIHRITNEKVKDCPKFSEIAEDLIKFIGQATIIAHNSKFDMRMINNELRRCGWEKYPEKRFIDTLEIARFMFPDLKNSQDALCERFGIDNHLRVTTGVHSAMEDTGQLYHIYQKLKELLSEKSLTPYDFKKNHSIF